MVEGGVRSKIPNNSGLCGKKPETVATYSILIKGNCPKNQMGFIAWENEKYGETN